MSKEILRPQNKPAQPEQKKPQNCGTGYCSCIECVMKPTQGQGEPNIQSYLEKDNSQFKFSDYESDGMHHNKAAQQEPVGKFAKFTDGIWREVTDGSPGVSLYTTPPQRKPLTVEQIEKCIEAADTKWADAFVSVEWARHLTKAIEAAHGIKE
jgi:hypothetical protein